MNLKGSKVQFNNSSSLLKILNGPQNWGSFSIAALELGQYFHSLFLGGSQDQTRMRLSEKDMFERSDSLWNGFHNSQYSWLKSHKSQSLQIHKALGSKFWNVEQSKNLTFMVNSVLPKVE